MNETFLLTDHTKLLGSLEFPQKNRFDLIVTNPPFTVRGTGIIKQQISEHAGLRDIYEQAGMGTESLFLRWIIAALKPNCQAFVIVPTGILSRTETAAKDYLLRYCDLDAIISLPENTFYNTANPTYVLCFTKKEKPSTVWRQNSNVFCYIVREIGETRDTLRFPCKTDLNDLVRQFRAFYADKEFFEPRTLNCKIVEKSNFKPENRWDIDNVFWTEDEKIQIGLAENKTIDISHFESELDATVESIKIDLDDIRSGKESNENIRFKEVSLGDLAYFKIIPGVRITRAQINKNPGYIPVISGHLEQDSYIGHISEGWLQQNEIPVYRDADQLITVNANGSVGTTYLRIEEKYTVHDDVNIIKIMNSQLNPLYIVYSIRESVANARFKYNAKLYAGRLSTLMVRVPIDADGNFDADQQALLSMRYERMDGVKKSIIKFANNMENKFIT